jgi:hypothetical protein
MIGQHRKQIEAVGNRQEARWAMRSSAIKNRDFGEANCANVTGPGVIERLSFAGGEPLRRDPCPENKMGVDQYSGDHLLGSKARMTSSGMVKSFDSNTPLSSPYLIGCRLVL